MSNEIEVLYKICKCGNVCDIEKIYDNYDIDPIICFEWCCASDNVNIAKWLYENKFNAHTNTVPIFIFCCNEEKIEMVKWLVTIYPEYEITMKNNRIVCYKITDIYTLLKSSLKNFNKNINNIANILKIKKIKHIETVDMCSICLSQTYTYPIKLNCKHTFCFMCLIEWVLKNENYHKTCPMCDKIICWINSEIVVTQPPTFFGNMLTKLCCSLSCICRKPN